MVFDENLGITTQEAQAIDRSSFNYMAGVSFSGNERNRLFLNVQGKQFHEVGGISGLDHPGDTRSFAITDFNRDGWPDIAMVNANAPLLQLFQNRISDQTDDAYGNQVISLRFVGGNDTARPSPNWSSRDGYGVLVTLQVGDFTITREHRAGEGLAAQNSPTMLIGIGKHAQADSATIRWPSGRVQSLRDVSGGTLVTVYENPLDSPDESAFEVQPYQSGEMAKRSADAPPQAEPSELSLLLIDQDKAGDATSGLTMYSTMATWCTDCKAEIPQLDQLRSTFDSDSLRMLGVAVDENDSEDILASWVAANNPPYQLLTNLTEDQIALVQQRLVEELGVEGVPATVVVDSRGQVLLTKWGPPTISEIRQLLHAVSPNDHS
ncbi:MAG: ASPIC/UnbV domain-containing protein [Dehalococcoidia bacterium]